MKIALAVVFAVILVIGGGLFLTYVSAYNLGNSFEQQIEARYKDNQNVLSSYTTKVMEAVQVPAMQRDDLVQIVKASMEGRYGEDGSKATFQWIKEQNPQVDSSVYTKIQSIIESGRNDFQRGQTQLLDVKREYKTALGSFWNGMWLRVAGYPKIDLAKYDIIVESGVTEKFETKKDEPIKLR